MEIVQKCVESLYNPKFDLGKSAEGGNLSYRPNTVCGSHISCYISAGTAVCKGSLYNSVTHCLSACYGNFDEDNSPLYKRITQFCLRGPTRK